MTDADDQVSIITSDFTLLVLALVRMKNENDVLQGIWNFPMDFA